MLSICCFIGLRCRFLCVVYPEASKKLISVRTSLRLIGWRLSAPTSDIALLLWTGLKYVLPFPPPSQPSPPSYLHLHTHILQRNKQTIFVTPKVFAYYIDLNFYIFVYRSYDRSIKAPEKKTRTFCTCGIQGV